MKKAICTMMIFAVLSTLIPVTLGQQPTDLFDIEDFSVSRASLQPGETAYVNVRLKNLLTTNNTLTHQIELQPDLGTSVSILGAGIVTLYPNEERSFTIQVRNNGALTASKDVSLVYKAQSGLDTKTRQFELVFAAGIVEEPYAPNYDVFADLNAFSPAKILLDYAYTANFSGPLNMQTASAASTSIWSINLSPVSMQFTAQDVDTYEFDVIIAYNGTVGQSLTISVWSGDLSPNVMRYWVKSNQIKMHFRINVATQPQYPTTNEVAEQVIVLVRQELTYYYDKVGFLTSTFESTLWTLVVIVVVALIVSLISLYVAMVLLRRKP